jgi:NADPH:quinone reductase-like Zn-dependent oxidoreductase
VKAIVCRRYGPPEVLRLEEVPRPVPGEGEVLIRIRAAAVNPADAHMMRGRPAMARLAMGLRRPKRDRIGADVAGEVEAVGPGVTRFRAGDAVFGACPGALADYGCALESKLCAKPPALSFEAAAAVPVAGLTALQGLRDAGRLRPGQKVLVIGASGGIGTFAVQIAKALGGEVTGVCSAGNFALVRSLGADRAIDYAAGDFTRGGERWDLIFDLASTRSFRALRRALVPGGTIVPAGLIGGGGAPSTTWMLRWAGRSLAGIALARFSRERLAYFVAKLRHEDLSALAALIEAGEVTPVIDRRYPLDRAAEALGYLVTGHARGKVVIDVDRGGMA